MWILREAGKVLILKAFLYIQRHLPTALTPEILTMIITIAGRLHTALLVVDHVPSRASAATTNHCDIMTTASLRQSPAALIAMPFERSLMDEESAQRVLKHTIFRAVFVHSVVPVWKTGFIKHQPVEVHFWCKAPLGLQLR